MVLWPFVVPHKVLTTKGRKNKKFICSARSSQIPRWQPSTGFRSRGQDKSDSKMAPLYRVQVTWPGQVRIQDRATLPGSGHVGRTSQIPIWRHSNGFRSRGQDKSDSMMASLKKFSGHVATTSQIPRWRHSTRFRSRGRESHPAFIFFNFPPCSHLLRWPTGSKREGGPPSSSPLALPPPLSPPLPKSAQRVERVGGFGMGWKGEGGGRWKA